MWGFVCWPRGMCKYPVNLNLIPCYRIQIYRCDPTGINQFGDVHIHTSQAKRQIDVLGG